MMHSLPWTGTWNAYSKIFDEEVVESFKALRLAALPEAKEAAKDIDDDPKIIRDSLKQFSPSIAIGADLVHLKRMASLPDVALKSLGAIFKQ